VAGFATTEIEPLATAELRAQVQAVPLWYHTIELAPGVITPGWFDLRPVVGRLPWPDVRGRRCLDVGTYDGFLAFELERRGAREVLCTDLGDERQWDWPPDMRGHGPARLQALVGSDKDRGFRVAHAALRSAVQRVELSVYDLSPAEIGRFDVVVCGTLLLHLEEPLRALEAIRSVCDGVLLSAEQVRLGLTLLHPRRALAELNGSGELNQWWVPNAAGHRRMLFAAGFAIERTLGRYAVPFGPSHPSVHGPRAWLRQLAQRQLMGHSGVPHSAVLARPRV
jgi:tRNA (mo5U34)-methyltransferase